MTRIDAGDPAPDVTFQAAEGPRRLRELIGKKALVLYFYPKDETPGCTAEACAFRDQHDEFVAAGAVVVGVSGDSAESHARFKAHHGLPFDLVSDPGGAAARAFGVKRTLGLVPGRVTFVIDDQGVVRHRYDSLLRA